MYNYAAGFCVVGQMLVVYAPFLQDIFQTEALGLLDLAGLLVLSSSVLWVDEIRKWREANGGGGKGEDEDRGALLV
jgi:Ca2+-transporting ATPase